MGLVGFIRGVGGGGGGRRYEEGGAGDCVLKMRKRRWVGWWVGGWMGVDFGFVCRVYLLACDF